MQVVLHLGESLLVMVDSAGMERIGGRDPMVIDIDSIEKTTGRPVKQMIVTFGSDEDVAEAVRLARSGQPVEAIRHVCRGYTDRPEDAAPIVRLPNGQSGGTPS